MNRRFTPSIFTKGLILIAIPLLFELTFGITMFCLQSYYREVIAQESKAKAIIYHANEMWLNATDAVVEKLENNIFADVHNEQLTEEKEMQQEFEILRTLVADDRERTRQLKKLKRVCDMLIKTGGEFDRASAPPSAQEMQGGIASLTGKYSSFQRLQKQLKAFGRLIREFREPDELKSRDAEKRVARIQSIIEIVIICAVIFSVCMNGLLLAYFMKGINRGILNLLENTKRMARSEPLLPELDSKDELGRLDQSFHQMAKQVETATRRERATINNAGDMIYVLGEDLKILSANPAAANKLGLSTDEIKEKGIEPLILENDRENVLTVLAKAKEEKTAAQLECRISGAEARLLWTSWSIQWSDEDNEYFCVSHDITEQKRMEQMKQEFFGMISHDMRTPLTSILTAVDCCLSGVVGALPEKAIQYLQLAEQGGQYLLSLMQDLLDMERLSAGAFPLKIEHTNLREIFSHAASMVSPLAVKAGLSIKIPEANYEIDADKDAITRVLVNLISNAVKFAPAGTSIEVNVLPDREFMTIEVSDHGRGIPEEIQSNVFERFKQVNIEDAKRKGGSGLGLAICKGFVEAHGGNIGVRSILGKGSTFWFRIPLNLASA